MTSTEFTGFGGVRLSAEVLGSPDDPPVLMLPAAGETRQVWTDAAAALVEAGRQPILLDLRGHGASGRPADGRYDFEAFVADLRAVLSQLPSRPAIVAAGLGGWIATAVLAGDGAHLATGLVLADAPPRLSPDAARAVGVRLKSAVEREGEALNWDPKFLGAIDLSRVERELEAAAPALSAPTLFVLGSKSPVGGAAEAEAFVGRLQSAEFVEIDGAGGERAETFNAVLLDFLERRVPRDAPEYRAGSDARTLRDALGCFATGVTIVTTFAEDGRPVGLTANSFTSVSLDPALLLVCIGKSASTLPHFRGATRFSVNVLHIGQQPTSTRFTRKDVDRFEGVPWEAGEFGSPILTHSLASFECEREVMQDAGDHVVLMGKVLKARFEPRRDPLLYFRGRYRRLHMS